MDMYSARPTPPITTQPNTNAKNDPLHDMVANLFRDGKISMQQSLDIFSIISGMPPEQVFSDKISKISPENAAALTQAYHISLASNTQPAAPQNKTLPLTSEQRAQLMINNWVQQGYLTKQDKDYTMKITFADGVYKINDNIVDPQVLMQVPDTIPNSSSPAPVTPPPATTSHALTPFTLTPR